MRRDPRLRRRSAKANGAGTSEAVTNEDGPVTNAELSGTKRPLWTPLAPEARRAALAAYAAWLVFSLFAQMVNAISGVRDIERLAMDADAWEPFVWEGTSWLGYAVSAP